MLPPSIWNSEAALSSLTFWVNVIGGAITFAIAVISFITAFRETTSRRKKRLERLLSVLALLLATLCGFNIFAAKRQGDLQEARLTSVDKKADLASHTASGLQQAHAPRHIGPDQENRFIQACKILAPGERVKVEFITGDPETFEFACEINELLRKAGFEINSCSEMGSMMLFGPTPTGVALRVAPPPKEPVHAAILQRAFTAIDIDAPGMEGAASGEEDVVVVRVGPKKK